MRPRRLKVVSRDFGLILQHAAIKTREFHDLRRTAICNWFAQGLSEYEIVKLAGHADFKTTHKFYLHVRDDLMDRARQASSRALSRNLARTWHAPQFSPTQQDPDSSAVGPLARAPARGFRVGHHHARCIHGISALAAVVAVHLLVAQGRLQPERWSPDRMTTPVGLFSMWWLVLAFPPQGFNPFVYFQF